MRQKIHVTGFSELQYTISISYLIGKKEKLLIIDKHADTELMELFTLPVNQYDCICVAAAHEEQKENKNKRFLDLTNPDSLFENICNIVRADAKLRYGINL
jgi:hypothetical protein